MLRPNFQRHSIKASAAAAKERLPVVFNVSPSREKPELIVETGITFTSITCRVSFSPFSDPQMPHFSNMHIISIHTVEDVAYFIPLKLYGRRMVLQFLKYLFNDASSVLALTVGCALRKVL